MGNLTSQEPTWVTVVTVVTVVTAVRVVSTYHVLDLEVLKLSGKSELLDNPCIFPDTDKVP